jgi:hypothetical protein
VKILHHDVLDREALAALIGISAEGVKQMRSRNPLGLPPPFMTRPLRWRREAVIRWMEQREREESDRIQRMFEPVARPTRSIRGAI